MMIGTISQENATQIDGCVDCLFYVEYGTIPEDRDSNIVKDIARIWPNDPVIVNGGIDCEECQNGQCESAGFSWKACELCGSNLGGDRFHMTVFS